MTASMVERVKSAIILAMPYLRPDPEIDYDAVARAAIAEMREPTEAMAREGLETGEFENEIIRSTIRQPIIVWQAMIDKALK